MSKYLPLTFLASVSSLFGLIWIIWEVDPDTRPWKFFALFLILLFVFVLSGLGTMIYVVRTRFLRKYSAEWYFRESFKMAFFVALFVSLSAALGILGLVNTFNVLLLISSIALFAFWSYLGKKH